MALWDLPYKEKTINLNLNDKRQEAVIACALVNNDAAHIQRSLQVVAKWVEENWPQGQVIYEKLELL